MAQSPDIFELKFASSGALEQFMQKEEAEAELKRQTLLPKAIEIIRLRQEIKKAENSEGKGLGSTHTWCV